MRSPTLLIAYAVAALSLMGCAGDATSPLRGDTLDPAMMASAFTVSIQGPTEVTPHDLCTWQAVVSGGTPPYTYEWSAIGMIDMGAPGPNYWSGYKTWSSNTWISVKVVDAAEQVASTLFYVGTPEDQFQRSCY